MDTLAKDDIDFLKWLDSSDNLHYWSFDLKGDKVITRHSWDKAYEEYKRLKYGLPPAKYRREGYQLHPGNE